MNDALRVRGRHAIGDLQSVLHHPIHRGRSLQRLSLDVFHYEIVRPDIVQSADVGMVQRSDGSGLALETLRELFFGDFDRDDPVQACIASLIHFAHAAGAERREDLIRAEFVTGGEWHLIQSA